MIDRALMMSLRSQINAAIAEVAKKNGVTLVLAGGKFTDETAEFKLQVAGTAASSTNANQNLNMVREIKAAKDFLARGFQVGLTKNMLGQTIVINNDAVVIKGYMTSRSKYNVLCFNKTQNKEMLYSHITVIGKAVK